MSNIVTITGFDKNTCQRHSPNEGKVTYGFHTKGTMSNGWTKEFALAQKKDTNLSKYEINIQGNLIKVVCPIEVKAEEVAGVVQKLVTTANDVESNFNKDLDSIKFNS